MSLILSSITEKEMMMTRDLKRCPTHPGELLREDVIPATKRSKSEIAKLLGVSRQHLHDVLAERKPVSPEFAVRLGKLFGNDAGLWIRMQGAYDEWNASRTVDVSNIPTVVAAE
ncbi:HigA family addiction module antitoxin [Cognatiyoonia sp. IB215182]|uniref:HigA family addiction module antitoxin n=1 Tax=Cognatiyoonia sp. IB215182 TaxID=3097353 RepID=UPI002A24DB08|nr:HigA family addiction module antitoxin [Cognatiyoonia sp. IB215182]